MSCIEQIGSFWAFPNSNSGTSSADGGEQFMKLEKVGVNPFINSSSSSPSAATMEKEVKESTGKAAGGAESDHDHMHIWTERERRKKMRNMFSSLHALLPQLPAKVDKSTIVDEAVKYIKSLERTLQTMEKQRLDKLRSSITTSFITPNTDHQLAATDTTTREAFLADHQYQGRRRPSKNLMVRNSTPHAAAAQTIFPPSLSPATTCFQTWFSPNVVINMCGDNAQISVCSPRKPGLLSTIIYILEKHKLDVISAHVSSNQYRCMCMIHVHASGASDSFLAEALSVEDTFKLAAGEMNLWLLSSC